ncbi:hydrolase [Actinoplanes ianthinogenes]|uniref:Hydrolase n=1 Tax=Actinoplanes ianthinogenes TaxID=122358 RepID=A0ABM7M0F8_9ACTN|nr:HAD family hydrolase [Actinoplanes ianthinogenes]BCJ45025.1 hydrolase [Actinoplanes ianthinogenes]GGR52341.1 hydrolase [Actinoplanes ianthinogenes]
MTLTDLVTSADCLLIDFDGPICSVFAGYPARPIAEEMRALAQKLGGADLARPFADLPFDPLEILVAVAAVADENLLREVSDTCRDAEVKAVASATPTPGAADVLRAAHAAGRSVAIVSNNSGAAIEAYLHRHDLLRCIDGIAARYDGMDPRLLKPNPYLVERGPTTARASRDAAVFIGESVTDIHAGQAAGIPTVGYANKPGKHQRLTEAGADVVIDSMHAISDALHSLSAKSTR